MADMRLAARQTPTVVPEGAWANAWALRNGALVTEENKQAWVYAGYGFHVTVGAFSTPITGGGAGTIFDQDQPEGIISVPSGAAIIPLRFHVQCHTPLLATDADESEILIAVDRTAAWPGDGTVTSETIFNMRTDNPITSVCTAASAATANITNPTLGIELAGARVTGDMNGTPANALWGRLDLLYEPKVGPVIVGPAAVYVYWGGTVATSGFGQFQWIEFTSAFDGIAH